MITDSQTDFLYLADSLPKKYRSFYKKFEKVLTDCKIDIHFLPATKDVWSVDYMPIQIAKNKFVEFTYNPDYLRKSKKGVNSISNVDAICKAINISPEKSNIILDGGNVVKWYDKVIMCDKIFIENQNLKEKDLINELQNLFQVDKIYFIPTDPYDFTGHADGMVRFLNNDTVLINDYSKEDLKFQIRFRMSLHNAGLQYIEIPYNPYDNKKDSNANGLYLNYLQMQQVVIIPTFGIREDEIAVKQIEELFRNKQLSQLMEMKLLIMVEF